MELLKEEMNSDESYIRINAIYRVKLISQIIGVERTKTELLPYLELLTKKEEDEVIYAIAT